MLQSKDIKNLSELKATFVAKHNKDDFFTKLTEILKLGKISAVFSKVKQKGIPTLLLVQVLISFPFIEKNNVYSFTKSYWIKYVNLGKDSLYRLKNNPLINWRSFLFGIVKRTLITIETRENNTNNNTKAYIFDDTIIAKSGKKIEGVSKIWDHVIHKSIFGFQLLIMGYYDGTMFIPINLSFHRAKGKNKKTPFGLKAKDYKKQYLKKRDKKSQGFLRKKELDKSKIAIAIKMIKKAVKQKIPAQYVLTDSWFTCWDMIKCAMDNNLKYIGMFSKVKTKFEYKTKQLTYKQIRKLNRNKVKRNRRFKLYYIRTVVFWNGKYVVLYFTRKGKKGNWKVLLNTDLSSNFQDTVSIYQIRWTIEVFFKEAKQHLNLGKSQSNDFDAQIADTTIVMIQYLFLALQKRADSYETIGKVFEKTKEFTLEKRLHERLIALLFAIVEVLNDLFEQLDIEDIMYKSINNKKSWKILIRLLQIPENEYKTAV